MAWSRSTDGGGCGVQHLIQAFVGVERVKVKGSEDAQRSRRRRQGRYEVGRGCMPYHVGGPLWKGGPLWNARPISAYFRDIASNPPF